MSLWLNYVFIYRINPTVRAKLAEACVHAHVTIEAEAERFYRMLKRRVYVTPKSYLDLINSYRTLLKEKNQELSENKNKLSNGIHYVVVAHDINQI